MIFKKEKKEKKPIKKSAKCPMCDKRFKYEPSDVFVTWGQGFVVKCPNCDYKVELRKF